MIPVADFTPISYLGDSSFVLVASANVPGATLSQLLEYGRANPGRLNFAAANPPSQIVAAQLRSLAGLELTNVPYKGDVAAMPDLLTGRVHLLVAGANVVAPHVAERKLQGLAVLLNARSPLLPEVPTITEAGLPGLAFYSWSGLFGPARMPRETADRLAREVNAVLNRPEVRGQLERIGFVARGSTPQAMGEHLKTQIESWRKLGKEAGIQPE